jgi:hypothetical protein
LERLSEAEAEIFQWWLENVDGSREPINSPAMRPTGEITARAVVTCEGPAEPIVLTVYGPNGKMAYTPLLPKRALTLAQELLERGNHAIRADWWGPE